MLIQPQYLRMTSAAFVDFLGDIVTTQPARREIHVIADNLSTHKMQAVRTFLVAHPNVHLHFTPTYASWLNQIELWFSKIQRPAGPRHLYVGRGPGSQDSALHPALQPTGETDSMAIQQPDSSN